MTSIIRFQPLSGVHDHGPLAYLLNVGLALARHTHTHARARAFSP
jgi:hypothetical protein